MRVSQNSIVISIGNAIEAVVGGEGDEVAGDATIADTFRDSATDTFIDSATDTFADSATDTFAV